jgi:hypothetical protein
MGFMLPLEILNVSDLASKLMLEINRRKANS